MKVHVKAVIQDSPRLRVAFDCDYGQLCTFWIGEPPSVGESRHVELEVGPALTVGQDLVTTTKPYGVHQEKGVSVLIGQVTAAHPDGYVRLMIGFNGVDLEVLGELPIVGKRYQAVTHGLQVFDCY